MEQENGAMQQKALEQLQQQAEADEKTQKELHAFEEQN